jgi:FkbM family methyltransferase
MSLLQSLKDHLVGWGPGNPVTQTALRLALRKDGFRLDFNAEAISLKKAGKVIRMRPEDLSLVPVMAEMHSHFFEMLEARVESGGETIDFTKPGVHRYRRTGLELLAPSVAEDDSMPQYTLRYQPAEGAIVFDVGAHAGLTTIELSRMVGSTGRVFAFEPDESALHILAINLERHQAANVTVVEAALGERSGEALFSMDGTQAAGLVDSLVYVRPERQRKVRVMTLQEACEHTAAVPAYIKCDIEGAELGMIRGSLDFLARQSINLAFETHRLRDGTFTHDLLQPLLQSAGYAVEHVVEAGTRQNFMYATPDVQTHGASRGGGRHV